MSDESPSHRGMPESLVERIKAFADSQATPPPFAAASERAVHEAERTLGFPIPPLLKACYLNIGNGGFGPGYGIIGVEAGYVSDLGTLVEAYAILKQDQETEGRPWPISLLPFCEFGCNVFSCVNCDDPRHPISTFEDSAVWPQRYALDTFFELWMRGVNVLSHASTEVEHVEIINPFTGKKTTVSKRRRR